MGTVTLDFLLESFLLAEEEMNSGYAQRTNQELFDELLAYRTHVNGHLPDLIEEVERTPSSSRLYIGTENTKEEQLIRLGLYASCVLLDDEMYNLSSFVSESAGKVLEFLQQAPPVLTRGQIAETAKWVTRLKPMLVGDYVKLLPFTDAIRGGDRPELAAKPGPVPLSLVPFFAERVRSSTFRQTSPGVFERLPLIEGDPHLLVEFDDPLRFSTNVLLSGAMSALSEDGTAQVTMTRKLKIEPERFQAWVRGQELDAGAQMIQRADTETAISRELGAGIVTRSEVYSELLRRLKYSGEQSGFDPARLLYNYEVPVLDGVSGEDLMRVRQRYESTQTAFSRHLSKTLSGLRNETDPVRAERMFRETMRGLFEDDASMLAARIDGVRGNLKTGGRVALAFLGVSVATDLALGSASLVGTSIKAGVSAALGVLSEALKARKLERTDPMVFLVRLKEEVAKRASR